jgi:hypothetical protein
MPTTRLDELKCEVISAQISHHKSCPHLPSLTISRAVLQALLTAQYTSLPGIAELSLSQALRANGVVRTRFWREDGS